MLRKLSVLSVLVMLLAGCGGATPVAPTGTPAAPTTAPAVLRTIRLPMGYIPSVQYAPFYVAAEKGYFAAEGLRIEFDYAFETDGVQLVGAGQLPFAVVSGEQVLLARAQGLPVVYIMAWFQKYPVAVIAKADSGITKPADLKGKKIGVPLLGGANYVGLRALLTYAGLRLEDVSVEAIGFNQVPALTAGQIDAAVVYANNEPVRLAAQGEKLNVITVGDVVPLAANGILSSEDLLAKEPELARGFIRALLKGVQDVIANPDEALTISKKYAPELKDDAVEKQVLLATIELWKAEPLGRPRAEAWQTMQQTLLDAQLLTTPLELNQAYTDQFLP